MSVINRSLNSSLTRSQRLGSSARSQRGPIKKAELNEIVNLVKPAENLIWILLATGVLIANDTHEKYISAHTEKPKYLWNLAKKLVSSEDFLQELADYSSNPSSDGVIEYVEAILEQERFKKYNVAGQSITAAKLKHFLKNAISHRASNLSQMET